MQAEKVDFEEREYGKIPLSEQELTKIISDGPIENFLNTRTFLYRKNRMKQKSPTREEAIRLMLKDPNLLKRPVIVKGRLRLTGFVEGEIKQLL